MTESGAVARPLRADARLTYFPFFCSKSQSSTLMSRYVGVHASWPTPLYSVYFGSPPAFFVTTILSFREEQGARDALASEGAKALAADVPNFSSVRPLVQFNTAVP